MNLYAFSNILIFFFSVQMFKSRICDVTSKLEEVLLIILLIYNISNKY